MKIAKKWRKIHKNWLNKLMKTKKKTGKIKCQKNRQKLGKVGKSPKMDINKILKNRQKKLMKIGMTKKL